MTNHSMTNHSMTQKKFNEKKENQNYPIGKVYLYKICDLNQVKLIPISPCFYYFYLDIETTLLCKYI